METSARRLGEEVIETSSVLVVFEYPMFGDIAYDIQHGDSLKLHEIVRPRPYTLALADIPMGFLGMDVSIKTMWLGVLKKLPNCAVKVVATAKLWRIIILHSIDQ
ncbi:unnamed protein product [Calypogeia fissa]